MRSDELLVLIKFAPEYQKVFFFFEYGRYGPLGNIIINDNDNKVYNI